MMMVVVMMMVVMWSLPGCHGSCKTCSGPTNDDCDECKAGWEEDDEGACIGEPANHGSFTLFTDWLGRSWSEFLL